MIRTRTPLPRRRGFTIIEVVLASTLGLLVVFTCMAVFTAIERSDRRQEERLDETLEFARAHKAVQRAMGLIVMSDEPPREDEIKEKMEDQARLIDSGQDLPFDSASRFSIRHDPRVDGLLTYTSGPATRTMRPQVMEVTIRGSPIYGGETPPDPMLLQASTGRVSGAATPEQRREALARARSAEDEVEDSVDLDMNIDDAARAPGVRGLFELRPDGQTPADAFGVQPVSRRRASPTGEQGWTLWWRELPPRDPELSLTLPRTGSGDDSDPPDGDDEPGEIRDPTDPAHDPLAYDAELSTRRVRLVSGLRSCRWTAYRRDRKEDQFDAVGEKELPSFITLELESLTGRRENWMFEVAWSNGPEPGSLLENSGGGPLDIPGLIDADGDGINDDDADGGDKGGPTDPRNGPGDRPGNLSRPTTRPGTPTGPGRPGTRPSTPTGPGRPGAPTSPGQKPDEDARKREQLGQ